MTEQKNKTSRPEEELIYILLDFIIVSANLVKNISHAMRSREIKEGERNAYEAVRGQSGNRRVAF